MTPQQRLRELPKAMIKWYEIEKESRIACIVNEDGNSSLIAEALEEKGLLVDRLRLHKLEKTQMAAGAEPEQDVQVDESQGDEEIAYKTADFADRLFDRAGYDIIVAVDILEYARDPAYLLYCVRCLLKPSGKLLLAADNRLGIRYFCGDQDFFTNKNYDGIENYRHLLSWERESMKGRAYAKAEIRGFLEKAGFLNHRFFSVFPRIENPQLLLAEDYEPNEALDIRIFPEYNSPDTVFLMEEELYPSLMENQMLHAMANGFL